jgi:hypothetical protein
MRAIFPMYIWLMKLLNPFASKVCSVNTLGSPTAGKVENVDQEHLSFGITCDGIARQGFGHH